LTVVPHLAEIARRAGFCYRQKTRPTFDTSVDFSPVTGATIGDATSCCRPQAQPAQDQPPKALISTSNWRSN